MADVCAHCVVPAPVSEVRLAIVELLPEVSHPADIDREHEVAIRRHYEAAILFRSGRGGISGLRCHEDVAFCKGFAITCYGQIGRRKGRAHECPPWPYNACWIRLNIDVRLAGNLSGRQCIFRHERICCRGNGYADEWIGPHYSQNDGRWQGVAIKSERTYCCTASRCPRYATVTSGCSQLGPRAVGGLAQLHLDCILDSHGH